MFFSLQKYLFFLVKAFTTVHEVLNIPLMKVSFTNQTLTCSLIFAFILEILIGKSLFSFAFKSILHFVEHFLPKGKNIFYVLCNSLGSSLWLLE